MYKTKTNEEIGKYLSELIHEKFSFQRQFCKAYLEVRDNAAPDDVEVQRMTNRISQIINGKKAVQLEDFPIFAQLLGVSCEEILSAGECSAPTMNHLTNYRIAFSNDRKMWEEYVHREDKLILNLDEYGKTVIDYALEFKNFEFLKYLMENRYIWFVDVVADPQDYFKKYGGLNFGAGTSIERRPWQERDVIRWHVSCPENDRGFESRRPQEMDTLQYKLAGNDDLRMQMITLALEHGEVEMLYQLRAREIPSLYQACFVTCRSADCDSYYNGDMVKHIAKAGEEILDYFSEEFETKDILGKTNIFMFPYMTNLIDILIKENSPYLEKVLRASLKHNRNVYKKLEKLKRDSTEYYKQYYEDMFRFRDKAGVLHGNEEYVKSCVDSTISGIVEESNFYENGSIILYRDGGMRDGLITNIIRVNENSGKKEIECLIQKVNDLYSKIREKKF